VWLPISEYEQRKGQDTWDGLWTLAMRGQRTTANSPEFLLNGPAVGTVLVYRLPPWILASLHTRVYGAVRRRICDPLPVSVGLPGRGNTPLPAPFAIVVKYLAIW